MLACLLLAVSACAAQQQPATLPEAPAPERTVTDPQSTTDNVRPPFDPNAPHSSRPAPVREKTPTVVAPQQTSQRPYVARNAYDGTPIVGKDRLGSAYIPVDSWMYPALLRLYSLGYLDTAFISMRPWTRRSVLHMLEQTESDVRYDGSDEAKEIFAKLQDALSTEPSSGGSANRGLVYGGEQAYVGVRAVGGSVLRDSYNAGQSFKNDYGRPYSNGFNTYNGASFLSEGGPFSLYVRAEYQHAPSYQGYGFDQAQFFSTEAEIPYSGTDRPQLTIPEGKLGSQNNLRILEANASAHLYGHEISFGKSDAWLGPGVGGAMAWSNNAENMYTFRINRVEPLSIPLVQRVLGPIRYDFFLGSLKGHTYPNAPWAHSEIISFAPTSNFQFSLQRTIIWGGKGHEPITLHTFFKGFFDINDTTAAEKYSRNDPGARFSNASFSWRLPFLRRSVTLYTDSVTHDDVFPFSAPRRAGWRPGIYLSHLPGAPNFDFRLEGAYTDYVTSRSTFGQGNYYETIQRQGYTNKGFLLGDAIGREGKGGQAWLTYHLSGDEWIAVSYENKKSAKDFVPLGTTQNSVRVDVVKRLGRDLELTAWFQREDWKAPFLRTGSQSDTTGAFQFRYFPRLHTTNGLF